MHFSQYAIFLICLLMSSVSVAQMTPSRDDLQPVKIGITDQILEHGRLQQDNERLRREFMQLKPQYDQYLRKLQISGEEERMRVSALHNQQDSRALSQKSAEELSVDVMIKRTQIAQLKVTLMDLEEQEHLWKLKVSDAEYQKQTRELELAVEQNHYEQQADVYVSRIDQLNRAILRSRIDEKELLVQYSLLEDEAAILAHQQIIFENENGYLKKEAVKYEDSRKTIKDKVESLVQAGLTAQQKLSQAIEEKKKQKADLEQQLQIVRQQQQALDDQLTQALKRLEERGQLTADIAWIKKDNERLQSAIATVQSQAQQMTP